MAMRMFGGILHRRRLALASCVILTICGAARAALVDQSAFINLGSSFYSPILSGPLGQEFVPSVSKHVAIELFFMQIDQPVEITIQLRENAIDGEIVLGSTVSRTLPRLWREPDITDPFPIWGYDPSVTFEFADSLDLIPGQTYVIELLTQGSAQWAYRSNFPSDPYPNGLPILDGILSSSPESGDFIFRTWVVPTPSTLSLLLIAMPVWACRRSRR